MKIHEKLGETDDWYTPKYIFDAMGVAFDLDVAAPQEGPRYVPARQWIYTDSLTQQWQGFVWMNAPFGGRNGLIPWLRKFFQHCDGVALTPDRTSAPWFQDFAPFAGALLFLPKVSFERPDGTVARQPGNGTALWALGAKGMHALRNARKIGVLMTPEGGV